MKLSLPLMYAGNPREAADQVAALEKAGLDTVWIAEAYGFDSPTLMGYLAAKTETIEIGAAILKSVDAIAEINPEVAPADPGGAAPGAAPRAPGNYAPEIVVLLTDGANTRGIEPVDAAEIAALRQAGAI